MQKLEKRVLEYEGKFISCSVSSFLRGYALDKMSAPCRGGVRLLAFSLTTACNLRCQFCSRDAGVSPTRELPPRVVERVVREVVTLNSLEHVALSGGEPLLHPQFREIVHCLSRYEFRLSVTTNGTLIKDNEAKFLSEHVDVIHVSLDSHRDWIHDNMRGKEGAYRMTVEGIRKLKQFGAKVHINCVITKKNIDDIVDTMIFAYELGARGMTITRVYPIGRARSNYASLRIGFDEFKQAIVKVLRNKPRDFKLHFEDSVTEFIMDPRYSVKRMVSKRNSIIRGIPKGCFAGISMLHVSAEGEVFPCTFLEVSVGNIYKDDMRWIWQHSNVLKRLRDRSNLTGSCGSCQYKYICGGCRGRAYAFLGDYCGEDVSCPRAQNFPLSL